MNDASKVILLLEIYSNSKYRKYLNKYRGEVSMSKIWNPVCQIIE